MEGFREEVCAVPDDPTNPDKSKITEDTLDMLGGPLPEPRSSPDVFWPRHGKLLGPRKSASRIIRFISLMLFILGAITATSIIAAFCATSMRPHFIHFLYRWIVNSTEAVGTNPLGFALFLADAVVFFLATAGDAYRRNGWSGMLTEFKKEQAVRALLLAVISTAIIYGPVFIWFGVKSVYEDHQSLVAATQKLTGEKLGAERQRDSYRKDADRVPGLEQQVKDLQNQKPQLTTRPAPVNVPGQPVDEAEKKKRLAIRNKIGNLIYGAETIKTMCFNQADFLCVDAKNKWLAEALTYISGNLESSYEARFVAWNQPYLRYTGAYNRGGKEDPEAVNNAINFLASKSAILDQFIKEFVDK